MHDVSTFSELLAWAGTTPERTIGLFCTGILLGLMLLDAARTFLEGALDVADHRIDEQEWRKKWKK